MQDVPRIPAFQPSSLNFPMVKTNGNACRISAEAPIHFNPEGNYGVGF